MSVFCTTAHALAIDLSGSVLYCILLQGLCTQNVSEFQFCGADTFLHVTLVI